jgi:hypothetical protein
VAGRLVEFDFRADWIGSILEAGVIRAEFDEDRFFDGRLVVFDGLDHPRDKRVYNRQLMGLAGFPPLGRYELWGVEHGSEIALLLDLLYLVRQGTCRLYADGTVVDVPRDFGPADKWNWERAVGGRGIDADGAGEPEERTLN